MATGPLDPDTCRRRYDLLTKQILSITNINLTDTLQDSLVTHYAMDLEIG